MLGGGAQKAEKLLQLIAVGRQGNFSLGVQLLWWMTTMLWWMTQCPCAYEKHYKDLVEGGGSNMMLMGEVGMDKIKTHCIHV